MTKPIKLQPCELSQLAATYTHPFNCECASCNQCRSIIDYYIGHHREHHPEYIRGAIDFQLRDYQEHLAAADHAPEHDADHRSAE